MNKKIIRTIYRMYKKYSSRVEMDLFIYKICKFDSHVIFNKIWTKSIQPYLFIYLLI